MSLLVSSNLFPIDVKYAEVKLKNGLTGVILIRDEEQEKKYEGKMKELHTQWVQPNWKQHTEIIRESMVWDQFKGERQMDFQTYRGLCIERFLKSWDIVNDAGVPVPCTKDTIAQLEYNMANALIDQFIAKSVPTEQDLKN